MEEEEINEVQNQEGQQSDLNNQDPQPKNKSKEENFDGVVKKLNAKEKELKQMKAKLAELESKPKEENSNKVATIEAQLQQLLNEQKSIKLEREFEKINLNQKYLRASEALLESIAQENDFDLSTTQGLREATKLFAEEYPDLLNKKKDVGVPSGMTGNSSPALKVLDGDASEFFKLSKEERAEIARKARSK